MERDEVLQRLKGAEAIRRAKGVAHAALFGSLARGENGPGSDIDIMVEIEPDTRVGVYEFVGIVNLIEDLFPVLVDVSEREALKPYIRPSAERDALYAF